MKYTSKTKILMFPLIFLCFIEITAQVPGGIYISEFLAINESGIVDEQGDFSDWIEIHNGSNQIIHLENWVLTDKKDNLSKWQFPNISINPDEYILVFASDKNGEGLKELHTNFKLSGGGEYLALIDNEGNFLSEFDEFPEQFTDISYGYIHGSHTYLDVPTPGETNSDIEFLAPPLFSVERGFFEETFTVEIEGKAGSSIKYTIDGSTPGLNNGLSYNGPITIEKTTPLRAIAILNDSPSIVETQTYFFLKDVLKQPNKIDGYPGTWGEYTDINGTAIADYEMDPDVTEDPDYQGLMVAALKDIPTVSLVTDKEHFFSNIQDEDEGGIYIYTGPPEAGDAPGIGKGWERPVSFEYMDPRTGESFQVNSGIRLQGGHSRRAEKSPKHSFRLLFKSKYGPSKLKYPIFGEEGAEEFNTINLRATYGNSWRHGDPAQRARAQYIRDIWAKDTQLLMGHKSAHSKYIHLYINGMYWGLYNFTERPDKDFAVNYRGGDEEDWDVIKDYIEVAEGNIDTWNTLWDKVNGNITDNDNYFDVVGYNSLGEPDESKPALVDPVNLIDYILINFYGGNNDWDHHNWAAARNRVDPKEGFQFYCWDTEKILESKNENNIGENTNRAPSGIFKRLMKNDEFRLLFAERVSLHLMNNGLLTPEVVTDVYTSRAKEIELAVIAESARWGDYRKDVHRWFSGPFELYTKNDHWEAELERLVNDYFRSRTAIVLNQLIASGLFSDIEPPQFNQDGGEVGSEFRIEMSSIDGDIYYTTDGSDPRLIGGVISSSAIKFTSPIDMTATEIPVTARTWTGSEWSVMSKATFTTTTTVSSTEEYEASTFKAIVYPNPFRESVSIFYELEQSGNVTFEVYGMDGKKVYAKEYDQNESNQKITWHAHDLSKGIYVFRLKSDWGSITGKMVHN